MNHWIKLGLAIAGALAGLFTAKKVSDVVRSLPAEGKGDYPFVPAKHFREMPPGREIKWIVLHSTENDRVPGVADAVARDFATTEQAKSAHYIVGPEKIIQAVHEKDLAWHAPPANEHGIGIEFVGRAKFTREQWTDMQAGADLVKALAGKYGVPLEWVDAAGLLAGRKGVTTHAEVSKAWHKTDHTDPGAGFPLDFFVDAPPMS